MLGSFQLGREIRPELCGSCRAGARVQPGDPHRIPPLGRLQPEVNALSAQGPQIEAARCCPRTAGASSLPREPKSWNSIVCCLLFLSAATAAALPLLERAERPWTSAMARHWAGRVYDPLATRFPFLSGSNNNPAAPLVQPWAMAESAHSCASRPAMLAGHPSFCVTRRDVPFDTLLTLRYVLNCPSCLSGAASPLRLHTHAEGDFWRRLQRGGTACSAPFIPPPF